MNSEQTPDTATAGLSVRFWGVRGSISTPDAGTARYGGNTSSIQVDCGGRPLLLDAGTGIRYLGNELDVVLKYTFNPRADTLFGYSHFWSGNKINNSQDADFFYTQFQVNF